MLKLIVATASTLAISIATFAPVLANESTLPLKPTTVAVAGHSVTEAKMLSIDAVEIPAPEDFTARDGSAKIVVHIDKNGVASSATVAQSCGYYRIDQNAIKAVRAATYTPAMIDGQPVDRDYIVDVNI